MVQAVRPWIPRLRDLVSSKLSEADGPALEAWLGAIASALESMLYYAPGDPLPRYRLDWRPDGIALVPIEPAAAVAPCEGCPDVVG